MTQEIFHPLTPGDRAAMTAMREAIGSEKPTFGPELRPIFDALMEHTPDAPDVLYSEANIGGIAGWWCQPKGAAPTKAILYLHGGAYVVGSAKSDRHLAGQIAARAGVAAFLPDYRLAPENPFPAALEDACAAYRGLQTDGHEKIAIVGDSAGGGLALAVLAVMVSEGRNPLGASVMSPWTDLALEGGSMASRVEKDPLLSQVTLAGAASLYLGSTDPRDPRVSPLYGDLTGLPPVRIHVGEDEVLLDDSRRYADRLIAAGGVCKVHVWEGMTHVFPSAVGMLDAAGKALDDMGDFLRTVLSVTDRMKDKMNEAKKDSSPLPPDDPSRTLTLAHPDGALRHVSVVGDTYTILLDGSQTGHRYCLIDMFIPNGGGPPPHRHDFEETFTVLEGEIEATFRGKKVTVKAGETLHIPANAPHSFTNAAESPARLLCICAPSGQEEFFLQIGTPVPTRTSPPPPMSDEERAATMKRAQELAPKYRTEIIHP